MHASLTLFLVRRESAAVSRRKGRFVVSPAIEQPFHIRRKLPHDF